MSKRNEINSYSVLAIKLVHYLFSVGLFYIFFLLFRYGSLSKVDSFNFRYNYYVTLGYGAFLLFLNRSYNAYVLGYYRVRSLVFGQILSQVFSLLLTYIIVLFAWGFYVSPIVFLPLIFLQLIFDCVWTFFGNRFFHKHHGKRRTLLIYRNQIDKLRFGSLKGKPTERLFNITDEIQFDGSFDDLKDRLKGYDTVFVAGVNSACRNGILKYCKEENITGYFLPHVGDTIMQSAIHIKAFDSPILFIGKKELDPEYAVIKRVFDMVSSGLALIILSPIFAITALAIHFYDGGPVFYKQTRLTKDGAEFKILKFRSMRVNAEKDGVARLSTGENDERITPVGKIVRRYRIDELPQLWNIFAGDMSVVGPRPERPEIAEMYYKKLPDFKLRLQVKAGLTGYAQVYGKYNTAPYEKLEFDLLYINNMSILTDLQLCFATFAILFKKDSTEGIDEGHTTAFDIEESDKE